MTHPLYTGEYPASEDEERQLLQILQQDDVVEMKKCLARGLNPNRTFSIKMEQHHSHILLETCLAYQAPHCAKLLYQAGAQISGYGNHLITMTLGIKSHQPQILTYWLALGLEPNPNTEYELAAIICSQAAKNHDCQQVAQLLKHGADPNQKYINPTSLCQATALTICTCRVCAYQLFRVGAHLGILGQDIHDQVKEWYQDWLWANQTLLLLWFSQNRPYNITQRLCRHVVFLILELL